MEKAFIYKIVNLKNNKVYIGSTIKQQPMRRWNEHKSLAKSGKGYRLHQSIRKHGIDSFTFEIIYSLVDLNYLDTV